MQLRASTTFRIVALFGVLLAGFPQESRAQSGEASVTGVLNSAWQDESSYLRLWNNSSWESATATIRFLTPEGAETSRVSIQMPARTSKQYSIASLERLTDPPLSPAAAGYYVLRASVDKDVAGQLQHVIHNRATQALTNASTCTEGRQRNTSILSAHGASIKAAGYASKIIVQNDGTAASSDPTGLSFYDSETAQFLGFVQIPPIPAQGQLRFDLVDFMIANDKKTPSSTTHINVQLELNTNNLFLSHYIDHTSSKLLTDLTGVCKLPYSGEFATITAPPAKYKFPSYYAKYVDADGIAIVGSARVRSSALVFAATIIKDIVNRRPDLKTIIVANNGYVFIKAVNEDYTDAPEYAYNRRTVGTAAGFAPGLTARVTDHFLQQNLENHPTLLLHEFTHVMHAATRTVDPSFYAKSEKVYQNAIAAGLWQGAYAATNFLEYLAVASGPYFSNSMQFVQGRWIRTRAELEAYDPGVVELLSELYGSRYIEGVPRYQ